MQNYNKYPYKIPASSVFPKRQIIYMPECHSTNVYLEEIVGEYAVADGSVVITDFQFAGKGQRGNQWFSQAGQNLTFSVLVRPVHVRASLQSYLTMVFALGVTDWLLKQVPAGVHIKWPNDVLLNRKKVCGILIENQLQHDCITTTIAGIGLNVNQLDFPFPSATSLRLETGRTYSLPECFYDLMICLDHRYEMLLKGLYNRLQEEYLQRLFGLGLEITFGDGAACYPGTVLGVDDYGRLEVRTPWGLKYFSMKETTIHWPLK